MECKKVRFANEKFAQEYIDKLAKTSNRIRKPLRAYLCPFCKTWHLTSHIDRNDQFADSAAEELKKKNIIIKILQDRIHNLKNKIRKLKAQRN